MKQLSLYIILITFLLLWLVGCNPTLRRTAFELGFTQDSYRYGDLYRLSNLSQFKQLAQNCPKKFIKKDSSNNVALFIIGDSFTEKERINATDFNVSNYQRIHWNDSLNVQLDPNKRNILVLQTVERHFREHFAIPIQNLNVVTVAQKQSKQNNSLFDFLLSTYYDWENILKESEESLSSFLFSNDLFLLLKEWKAALNLNWFGRHNDQIALSPDGKYILFSWDTDSTRITSSFKQLPENELSQLIQQVNKTRNHYLSLGFDEVYLSIVPNKTSIVAPEMGHYNHLVERVQQHPTLRIPFINIWNTYSQHRSEVYSLSDTHWSCKGQEIWLEEINKVLSKTNLKGHQEL